MKKRNQVEMSDSEIEEYLRANKTVMLASQGPGGRPHVVPMGYRLEPGCVVSMTGFGRSQKVKNIERNPEISLLVESGDVYEELCGVLIYARAELIYDAEAIVNTLRAMSQDVKYGKEQALTETVVATAKNRVLIRCVPEKFISWDHSKLPSGVY
jgi:nitroimidazol reductase NimA-like FMN-containing flavoprotein (pyridoxamine 5'-phosphate oxidase superfamily)